MHLKTVGLAVAVLIFLASPVWPQTTPQQPELAPDPETRSTEIEAGLSYEDLTHGLAPWRAAYLRIVMHKAVRKAVYVSIEETERFSRRDTQFTAGTYHPFNKRWTALFEGSVSPTHAVLGKWSALGQIEHDAGRGWGVHAGLRHRQYNSTAIDVGNFTFEKYIKAHRVAYTFYAGHVESAGIATTHRVEMNHYYGNSAVNFNVAYGRELENIPPAGILRTSVMLVSLGGVHWVSGRWGLSYAANWQEQGRIYARRGVTLALRHKL